MADEQNQQKNPNPEFEVRGRVTRTSKAPVAQVSVHVYDQDLRKRQKLDETTTNEDGAYSAHYRRDQFSKAEQGTADLVVVVLDGDDVVLATSPIRFNAKPLETIDIVIADPARTIKSEYETVLQAVEPLLEGQDVALSALEDSQAHQDLSFLTRETGLARAWIVALVNAAQLVEQAHLVNQEPPSQAAAKVAAPDAGGIAWQAAFYGLLREGSPADLSAILALTSNAQQTALQAALTRNLIPAALSKQLDAIIAGLSSLKATQVLLPAKAGGSISLGDLLSSSLPLATRTAVAQLYVQSGADAAALQANATQPASLQQAESAGDVRKFIASLDGGALTPAQSKQVKSILAFNQLAGSYTPLVQELARMGNADATFSDPTALAALTADDWLKILARPQDPQNPGDGAIGHPASFASDADYAKSLVQTVARTYPTAAFAAGLNKDQDANSPFAATRKDLTTFLKNNPTFVFGQSRVSDYLAQGADQKLAGVGDRAALTAQLQSVERLSRFAPSFAPARALLADGIGSAQAAATIGSSRFVKNYGAAFASPAEARAAYGKARTVTLAALKTYLSLGRAANVPVTKAMDSGADGPVNTTAFNAADQANWTELFGSIDLCDCEDCQALDSAAAYFVDVLDFLRQGTAPLVGARQPLPGAVAPPALDALLKRRPDLANIELSCDNTNLRLPYVDLVNEVLETAVADPSMTLAAVDPGTLDLRQISAPLQSGLGLTSQALVDIETQGSAWAVRDVGWRYEVTKDAHQGVDVHPYPQSSGTEAELAANPQHINYKAYALIAQAGYPWILPLHLPMAEARAYLRQLKVPRADIMAALLPPDQRLASDDIAFEQLGLSRLASDIILGHQTSDPANAANAGVANAPWTFWGLDQENNPPLPTGGHFNGRWNTALQGVPLFLSQSGLKYPQLLDLLNTYFLNPMGPAGRRLSIVSTDKTDPATCDVDKLEIVDSQLKTGIAPLILSKIHRFVRMMNALGWSALDLDRALFALGDADFVQAAPRQLVHLRMLQKQLSQPLVAILAFFSSIDARVYAPIGSATGNPTAVRSLYVQLFRTQSLGTPADPAFTEDPAGLPGPGPLPVLIADHAATVLGALRLSADDLAALSTGPRAVIADGNLNLANLSALYRYAILAQSLQLTIPDMLRARVLFGDPFTSPETTLWFVRRVAAVRTSGFDIATLSYLLRHEIVDSSTQSTLADQFTSTLSSLRDQLQKIASDNLVAADPQGTLTRAKLTLLTWNETYVAQAIALLSDANTWSAPLAALPAGLVFSAPLSDRLAYDPTAQTLTLRGVLSTPDFNTLKAIPQGAGDVPYQTALQALFTNSRTAAQTFLVDRMRAFELPAFFAPAAPQQLAPPVVIPDGWQSRLQYNASTGQITVAGALTEGELAALQALPLAAPLQQAIQSLFNQAKVYLPDAKSRFLVKAAPADTDADPAHTAFGDLFDGTATPTDRFAYVLTRLCSYIRRTRSEGAVTQTLSSAFSLDPVAVNELLTSVLVAPSDATQPAMADLVAAGFVASTGDVTGAFYAPQLAVLTRMQKISTIAAALKLDSDLISLVDQLHVAAKWLDWNALPADSAGAPVATATWESVVRALGLRGDLLTAVQLEDLLTRASAVAVDKVGFVTALAAATEWLQADIEAWMGPAAAVGNKGLLNLTYPDDFRSGGGLRRLRRVFSLMASIGASPQQLSDWSPLDLAADAAVADRWTHAVSNATAIKNAVRAKYTNDVWLTTAAPIRNGLRELQCTALVAYLVAQHKYGKDDIDLYDYFLIDVDMGSCMKTTRLSQAICSVQLFVQRCLLSLEAGVQLSTEEASEWNEWRSHYRVWEDNRLVLLYPENWLEPSQRDDKTPPFEDFENELQQNDITTDTATTALRHYLQQVDLVGRLEIVAICFQQLSLVALDDQDTTHVFGRTYAAPHTYFYRQWRAGLWSPWEQVDLDIDGDHLIATVWNNHLYLCWPMFSEKSDQQTQAERAANADPTHYWEIKLAWSEFLDGKWQSKHVSTDTLRYEEQPYLGFTQTPDDVKFLPSVQTTGPSPVLAIDCYGLTGYPVTIPPPAMPVPPDILLLVAPQAILTVITFTVNGSAPSDADLASILVHARNHADHSMLFTNAARKFDSIPPGLPGFNPFDPAWDTILAGIAIALAISPLYGVVALDLAHTLDYFLDGSVPFSINKTSTPLAPFIWFAIDLAPLTNVTPGATTTIVQEVDPIGRFEFSSCRADVTALPKVLAMPPLLPVLTPPPFMAFEDEMIVETYANVSDTLGAKGTLGRTPGLYRLQTEAVYGAASQLTVPMAYQDDTRTYFVTAVTRPAGLMTHFQEYFHPQICSFIATLDRLDVDGLLTLANQSVTDPDPCVFQTTYLPNPQYVDLDVAGISEERTPREIVEFAPEGAYSIYNWEIFFHIPLLVATQLSANQRFDEARDWFHYIFDPTSSATGGRERFWKFKPFFDLAQQAPVTLEDLIEHDTGELETESTALAADPFQPFLVARMRPLAFMKAVVMKYLDNLIAWGDQLFAQDTMESINEATQLYVLASRILGRRPDAVPPRANPVVQTFNSLPVTSSGVFLDALVAIESYIFPSGPPSGGKIHKGTASLGTMPLFCIPKNDKLLGYWDAIDLRLYRIRHCMNAQGQVRDLAPFAPFIDPGLLVAAAAAGVDLDSILDDLAAPLPAYRFTAMLQKALELCNEVRALGSEMLSALEKRDAERLALLRATHELNLAKAVKQIKTLQVSEANANLAGLNAYQTIVTARQQYYQSREYINSYEAVHIQLSSAALIPMALQLDAEIAGALLHLIPDLKFGAPTTDGVTYGGGNIGSAVQAFGGAMGATASTMNAMGSLSATLGGYRRRQDEWDFQADVATKELAQVAQQIIAATIRASIAQGELDNQDLVISQSQEVYDYLSSKFTNAALYDWMVGQLSTMYFQSYKLAYDMAKRAERAYRHDLGLTDSSFIQFGYWDSLKKGLLAGERLQFDLRRMESDYLDRNQRELEIVKHVSLLLHDPLALLQLKETGQCDVDLPEMMFDVDFPGHYLRRLKTVSLSIPCVIGPYASINCTLTLLKSQIRTTNTPTDPYGAQANDTRFYTSTNPIQSIAVSQGQNDSGLFELNFRDERYLPFEGEGVISTWRLQLPTDFRSFDYATISDAILHLRYTARDGGDDLRQKASTDAIRALNAFVFTTGQKGLARLFSLRDDFPVVWDQFKNPPLANGDQTATFNLDKSRFPMLFQSRTLSMANVIAFAKPAAGFEATYTTAALQLSLQAGNAAGANALKLTDWTDFLRSDAVQAPALAANAFANWTLAAWTGAAGAHQRLDPQGLADIVLLVGYTVA